MALELRTRTTNATTRRRRNQRRRGFTLAESLIASVVLVAAVIGISGVLGASYQQSSGYGNTTTAIGLAQELMEEISSKPAALASGVTDKSGWPTETDRTKYDTVDDYNNYSDVSSSIQTSEGTTIDAGDGGSYIRTITVTSDAKPSSLTGTAPASDFIVV